MRAADGRTAARAGQEGASAKGRRAISANAAILAAADSANVVHRTNIVQRISPQV
jgi:hypothetical protein